MATIVMPNITRLVPKRERQEFINKLQELVQLGWQSALASGTLHRVHFDLDKRVVTLGIATGKHDAKGEPEFAVTKLYFARSAVTWPAHVQIKQFFIEGFDEMTRVSGNRKTNEIWFYIMPDGLTQQVSIGLLDTRDLRGGKPRMVTLELSPFSALFRVV